VFLYAKCQTSQNPIARFDKQMNTIKTLKKKKVTDCSQFKRGIVVDKMNRKKKLRILEMATTVASKSNMKIKHGAVIFYRNTLVASGCNTRNYRLSNTFSIHAEQNALNDFFKKNKHKCGFNYFSLFVVRLSDTGILMNSKPCLNCSRTLNGVSCINRVFYS